MCLIEVHIGCIIHSGVHIHLSMCTSINVRDSDVHILMNVCIISIKEVHIGPLKNGRAHPLKIELDVHIGEYYRCAHRPHE